MYSFVKDSLENSLVGIRLEWIAFTLVELVLELNPMETDSMQEALQQVHEHQDTECNGPEDRPQDNTL